MEWLGSGDGSVLGSKVVGHSFLIRANSVFISPGFIAALSWMGISIGQHNQQGKSNRDVESSSIVFLSSSGHQMRGSSSLAHGMLSSSVWACLPSLVNFFPLIPCPKSYVYWMGIHWWLFKSCFKNSSFICVYIWYVLYRCIYIYTSCLYCVCVYAHIFFLSPVI